MTNLQSLTIEELHELVDRDDQSYGEILAEAGMSAFCGGASSDDANTIAHLSVPHPESCPEYREAKALLAAYYADYNLVRVIRPVRPNFLPF